MATGLFILGVGGYWMSRLNLEISPWQIVWPRVVFIMGLSTIFAPLNVAAFLHIPPQLRGAAVGLLALLRNEGGSVGTSVAQTIQQRRDQFHSLRLGENLDPLNPVVNSYLDQIQPGFLQQTGDPVAAKQMALQTLANLREQQSSALSYFDIFFILSWLPSHSLVSFSS
jgi:DHA2 family multidrug resistance protein